MERKTPHDKERDFIAENWLTIGSFACAVCQTEKAFPENCIARTEVFYHGRLRADLAFLDSKGQVLGIIEVIDTHPPTREAFSVQKNLHFAYYRLMRYRIAPKRRSWDVECERGKFTYPRSQDIEPKWLCSPECLTFFNSFEGANLFNKWEPPKCYLCNGYFHANHLSQVQFLDWENP